MPRTRPFELYSDRYEEWFEKNRFTYLSELEAVGRLLPEEGKGLEVGAGSGRFAAPLGIRFGLDPSLKMCRLAGERKIAAIQAEGENIPCRDGGFDYALMVTAICFLDTVDRSLREIRRILRKDGKLIIGFVDKESPIGKQYVKNQKDSVFYGEADFYSVSEVAAYMQQAGFAILETVQTIFRPLSEVAGMEPVKTGYGEGSFVVILGKKA